MARLLEVQMINNYTGSGRKVRSFGKAGLHSKMYDYRLYLVVNVERRRMRFEHGDLEKAVVCLTPQLL
jgi:hypothetical protein